MTARIAIVNTKAANLHSVSKALDKVGANASVVSDPAEIESADAAVLPGVGAFDAAMRALNEQGLVEPVKSFAASGRPLLCVCLGMQILFDSSEEGAQAGLGLVSGEVKRFPTDLRDGDRRLKVPHMGWNATEFAKPDSERHPVFRGIPDGSFFYYVHSFHCVPSERADFAATTSYGLEVCAAVSKGEIIGTQFHPEKSGDIGLQIYSNFVKHASSAAVAG